MDYRIQQLRYRLREEPGSRVFYQLGEILRRDGHLDEAVEVLQRGLEHHPRYVAAWVALGRALDAAGRPEEAEKAFARALELDPENSVAARSIGEIAARRGDWVRAVKALKLARVLAPGDASLGDRIAEVEANLSGLGMLEEPRPTSAPPGATAPAPAARRRRERPPVVSVSDDDPFVVAQPGDTGVFELGEDVFTRSRDRLGADPEIGEGAEDGVLREGPSAGADVFEEVEDDRATDDGAEAVGEEAVGAEAGFDGRETVPVEAPAETDEHEDVGPTPGWGAAEAVVGEPQDEPWTEDWTEPAREVVDEERRAVAEAPFEPEQGLEAEAAPEEVAADEEPAAAAGAEVAAAEGFAFDGPEPDVGEELEEEEGDDELADEVPLPTMTLARLALQQGDRELAERTLLGVLEREPDHQEARSMLLALRSARAEPPVTERVPRPNTLKVAALQGWLETIRLGAERSR